MNINKAPKTVLANGLSYSLVSRLQNALSKEVLAECVKTKETIEMVDGRGTTHDVNCKVVELAGNLGAKFLAGTRSAKLRPRMVVDIDAGTVTLKELEPTFIQKRAMEKASNATETPEETPEQTTVATNPVPPAKATKATKKRKAS